MKKHKPDPRSEVAIKNVIAHWAQNSIRVETGISPELKIAVGKYSNDKGEFIYKAMAIIDLREFVAKRQPLTGIEKKIRKAIRPGKKR